MSEVTSSEITLSKRGLHTFSQYDDMLLYQLKSDSNRFHPDTNPQGITNVGSALDHLMETEIEERLTRRDVFRFRSRHHQQYVDFFGHEAVRKSVADFFNRRFKVANHVSPDEIILLSGSTSCFEALSHCIFDPGDVFLTPTPCYGSIFINFNDKSLAQPYPIELHDQPDVEGATFSLKAAMLENEIVRLRRKGNRVKGFVLINPNNPTGDIYSPSLLRSLLDVCSKYDMHVVVDEVYVLSLLDSEAEVSSVLSIADPPDPNRIHVIWSLSKDFGLPGLRTGVIHTRNSAFAKVLRSISIYAPMSNIIQDVVASILSDEEWMDTFLLERRRRLHQRYSMVTKRLRQMGAFVRPSKGGLFAWTSLKPFLHAQTHQAELELFKELFENGVYITPGSFLRCKSPGWFRFVISLPEKEVEEGLKRMESILKAKEAINF